MSSLPTTTEIALVTLLTEHGDEVVVEGYTDFDKAAERVVDLSELTGDPYFVQYIQLH